MELEINREKVKETFQSYVSNYDLSDEKIHLKVVHTYKVADLCEQIAKSEQFSSEDVSLAWLMGMLHDIGRFEQIRKYHTFIDSESVDHAEYGADILFGEGRIRDYMEDDREDGLIEKVIRAHNKYRVPDTFDVRERRFADVLRDADKIDILRVNVEIPREEVYNVTTEEMMNAEVSPKVLETFMKNSAILRADMKTIADHMVGHIAFAFELVYPKSREIARQQGFLDQMLAFQSDNEKTREVFEKLRIQMHEFLK